MGKICLLYTSGREASRRICRNRIRRVSLRAACGRTWRARATAVSYTHLDVYKRQVYHLAPAYAAAVVDRDPRCTAERVADDVLHGHVGREARSVVDVRRLAV